MHLAVCLARHNAAPKPAPALALTRHNAWHNRCATRPLQNPGKPSNGAGFPWHNALDSELCRNWHSFPQLRNSVGADNRCHADRIRTAWKGANT